MDESGAFLVPRSQRPHFFSLLLALVVPSAVEAELFHEFLRLRDGWPKHEVEIKGSSLDESRAAQLINLLCRYDVLVEFVSLNMATHVKDVVDDFKSRQADEITAHVTRDYGADIAYDLYRIGETIRAMPNQLFLQAFLTMHLVLEVIQDSTLYFVQRLPAELGSIAWIIDQKGHTLTQMEKSWTTLILPVCERYFVKQPMKALRGADYSHFLARYGFTAKTADKDMVDHMKWALATHGLRPVTGDETGVNASRLLRDDRRFVDSRDSLGLQLADNLASILRRALNEHLGLSGWKDFGRLLVRKEHPGKSFLQLGRGDNLPRTLEGHPAMVCRLLDQKARSMFLSDG